MKERGVAADQALLLMQPTLQSLYEAQKNYGFATDEATQALIDMGIANGVVGDQFQSVNQKMLDMLILIAEVLGADIPEAYRRQQAAAEEAAGAADAAAEATQDMSDRLGDGMDASTDGVDDWRDHIQTAQAATESYDQYLQRTQWEKPYDRADVAIDQMNENIRSSKDVVTDFADHAVREMQRVGEAVDAVSFGHSPGGLKEIPYKTREALAAFSAMRTHAERDMGAVEGAVNAMSAAMDTRVHGMPKDDPNRWTTVPEGGGGTKVEIKNEVSIEITTLDPKDMDRVWREDFHPRLMSALDTNDRQTASRMEAATRRHRK
jgi:hypothetical protein